VSLSVKRAVRRLVLAASAAGTLWAVMAGPLAVPVYGQAPSEEYKQAMAQGELYASRRKYDLALEAYHKADKLARHGSAECYLKIASVERKTGDFPAALEDGKRAEKVAGEDKSITMQARLMRASMLAQMAGKPTDKKLKEAEVELRGALALNANEPMAQYDLGIVLLRQERDQEGVAELNTFVANPIAKPELAAEARRIIASPIRGREPFAPDFAFVTKENESLTNASLRGKVVLFDFWGTWCPPCRASIPTMRDLQKKYAGKPFQLVGVSSDNDEDVWRTFIEAQKMSWPEYIDLSGRVLKAFSVESFPTYVLMDKDGVIRFRQSGFGEGLTASELEEAINKALKRASDPALAAAGASSSKESLAASPAATNSGTASGGGPARNATAGNAGNATPSAPSVTPLLAVEDGTIAGNVFKNKELQLTYRLPPNWIAAAFESLHAMNERIEAAAKAAFLQQHPEASDAARITIRRTVFYASRRGEGDGQRMSVPCLRMSVAPTRLDKVNLDNFRQMTESMAAAGGGKLLSPAAEFKVKDHSFARADFEREGGSGKIYTSFVETVAGDHLLTIEILATSESELQQIVATLQTMEITDD
jgi:thiol-disulfide isomerase/thioredoxin